MEEISIKTEYIKGIKVYQYFGSFMKDNPYYKELEYIVEDLFDMIHSDYFDDIRDDYHIKSEKMTLEERSIIEFGILKEKSLKEISI